MNPLTNRDVGQQPIFTMGRKHARMRQIRNGISPEEIVRNEFARQEELFAQRKRLIEESLKESERKIILHISQLCDEVDAISPKDVVRDHIMKVESVADQVENSQNGLLFGIENQIERLEQERQERDQLEQMILQNNVITPEERNACLEEVPSGEEIGEIISNKIAHHRQRLEQKISFVVDTLKEEKEKLMISLSNLCDEVDAISPEDVVRDHVEKAARLVAQAKNTQKKLLLAVENGNERFDRQLQEKEQLEEMLNNHRKRFRSDGSIVPMEKQLLLGGQKYSKYIAGEL